MKPAIQVDNLSKQYQIGHAQQRHDTLRDALVDGVQSMFQAGKKRNAEADSIWALKDVSFEVQPGEVLGVIGRNGAGKSTLLKILSRISEPTSGRAVISGRVGSLLEVGTGFHPELTGRENIFLNGAILGMRRKEIERKFDEIVAFSEIEKFLDTPVKRYSSGMYVRLAFAVAANLDPEVLLVDEVLAVGDASFQKKCLGKMGDISGEGRTILFVSHNLIALRNLCKSAILLENGICSDAGEVGSVIDRYLKSTILNSNCLEVFWESFKKKVNYHNIRIDRVYVRKCGEKTSSFLYMDSGFEIGLDFELHNPDENLNFIFLVRSSEEIPVFETFTYQDPKLQDLSFSGGNHRLKCTIPEDLLNEGRYSISLTVHKNGKTLIQIENLLSFEMLDSGKGRYFYHGKRPGILAPTFPWFYEKF